MAYGQIAPSCDPLKSTHITAKFGNMYFPPFFLLIKYSIWITLGDFLKFNFNLIFD